MNNENNYKRLMILTIILLVLVLGMSGYILADKGIINFSAPEQEQILDNEEQALQEMFAKTVFGTILEINPEMIKIEISESTDKTEQKEIKINKDTEFVKYELADKDNQTYEAVKAQLSDFKTGDQVEILLDKNKTESSLTAERVELVNLPETENLPAPTEE